MKIEDRIFEKIKQYDTIILHRHQRPDPDALGSQVGLREILRQAFPKKKIYAVGYDEPSLTWLTSMDRIEDAVYAEALVIVLDTANTERIDDNRYHNGAYLVKIDHHPNDEPYGDVVWVDTNASSTSEMIVGWIQEVGLSLNESSARLLYAGIVGDTGRFLFPSTTSRTLEAVAHLYQYDVDFSAVCRRMESMDLQLARLIGYAYDNLEVDEDGVGRMVLSQELLRRYQVSEAESGAVVGAVGRIETVKVWAVFVEQGDGSYRVRLRSKSRPINEIAKAHHGGGHPMASGANSYSIEENEQIYQELKQVLRNEA